MNISHVAIAAAVVVFSVGGDASAQFTPGAGTNRTNSAALSADPLDVLGQHTASAASRETRGPAPSVNTGTPRYWHVDPQARYLDEYNLYLAQLAQYEHNRRRVDWMGLMNGISAGLAVADQAIGVYEHALEAKALATYLRQ